MKKIVYLPLDERPCSAKFPPALFDCDTMRVVVPDCLGDKKIPADLEKVQAFLREACRDADGLVVSMDMLLYGGLVPSRLHHLPDDALCRRLEFLRILHRENPALRIVAFQCIMRCPTYSSSDEEPDYYGTYGAEIHQLGVARQRVLLGQEEAKTDVERLEAAVPAEIVADYLDRRAQNVAMDLRTLELAEENTIDFLVFPQDDAAPLGFSTMDQNQVRLAVREKHLQHKVLIYPGADELGMTLLSRLRNELEGCCPAVYPLYASEGAKFVVPPFEDRPLGETVRYQLAAAGCRPAATPEQADLILAITAPPANITGAAHQPRLDLDYDVRRSLPAFFNELCFWMDQGKPVTVCDNAYTNGGDLELLDMLDASGRMMRVAGYAGWNTSSNTMGTAIAEGVRSLYTGVDEGLLNFMALRYVEDCAYDSSVRQAVTQQELPSLGLDYFDAGEQEGEAAACVKQYLQAFVVEKMPSMAGHIHIDRVQMPWRRMFEVDLDVSFIP